MIARRDALLPLQAYDLAERQKRRIGEQFRRKIIRLHRVLSAKGGASPIPSGLPASLRRKWRLAGEAFTRASTSDPEAIVTAYRDVVMQFGLKRVDPVGRRFSSDLREFHRQYVANFPLPEEQESLQGFRALWRASPRPGGYEEVGYSVLCPLTGRYFMGLNFTVQPRSDSVHFIYGFISPVARGIGGFSKRLIDLMRDVAGPMIVAHLERCPADRPTFHGPHGPLILFEKNIIEHMSLTDILRDTAGIDIDRPPRRNARLTSSAISQNLRDLIWDRRGGRIVDYNYMQSSLDGAVCVPESGRAAVITYLNGAQPDGAARQAAERMLAAALGERLPGCMALDLCAFVSSDRYDLPAAQIRQSNEIFQGVSVIKDPPRVGEDIYFQAQMASLSERTKNGRIGLRAIAPAGLGVHDFQQAETLTRQLLSRLTWADLRAARDRSYGDWLRDANLIPAAPP